MKHRHPLNKDIKEALRIQNKLIKIRDKLVNTLNTEEMCMTDKEKAYTEMAIANLDVLCKENKGNKV